MNYLDSKFKLENVEQETVATGDVVRRDYVPIKPQMQFHVPSKAFEQQYSHIYFHRLRKLKPVLVEVARQKWGPGTHTVDSILDIQENHECVCVGTVYKIMELQPSVLKEYATERAILPMPASSDFTSDSDQLLLEDDHGRINLIHDLNVHELVTGVIAAFRGIENESGEFKVLDVCFAGYAPLYKSLSPTPSSPKSPKILFVSGIKLGDDGANPLLLNLLLEYICGASGNQDDYEISAAISRVVLVGNNVVSAARVAEQTLSRLNGGVDANASSIDSAAIKSSSKRDHLQCVAPVKDLDVALCRIASCCPVDVMPGPDDPANFSLPQQPMNLCMFPLAADYTETFKLTTNPHAFEVADQLIMGTSGQNIGNMLKYTRGLSELDLIERNLKWRHLAPTAPDTLACFPYYKDDPFVLDVSPHVYFVGNQREFQCVKVGATTVLRIPSFAESGEAVLYDVQSGHAQVLCFSTIF